MLAWNPEQHALGNSAMDATHEAFIALLRAATEATDADFPARFAELFDHTRAHFAEEDAKMLASRFPAIGEHVGEHRRILGELTLFQRSVRAGRTRMARAYLADTLPAWFGLHLITMDAALAAHLRRQAEPS